MLKIGKRQKHTLESIRMDFNIEKMAVDATIAAANEISDALGGSFNASILIANSLVNLMIINSKTIEDFEENMQLFINETLISVREQWQELKKNETK